MAKKKRSKRKKGNNNKALVSEVKIEEQPGDDKLCISEKLKEFGVVIDEVVFDKSIECTEDTEGEVRMVYITVVEERTAQKIEQLLSSFNFARSKFSKLIKNGRIVLRTEGNAEPLISELKKAGMQVLYQKDLLDQAI